MNSSLRRAAHFALKPDAIILGVATCLFGWSLAEAVRAGDGYATVRHLETLFLTSVLLLAAAGRATNKALGHLLAAVLSGPLPLFLIFTFFLAAWRQGVPLFSADHIGFWLRDLAHAPPSFWLMAAVSVAILCSATAATLRRPASRA